VTVAVSPLGPIQQALYERLTDDAELMGLVSGVFDHVPEGTQRPYVVVGEATSIPDNRHGGFGRQSTATLHIWTRERGFRGQQLRGGDQGVQPQGAVPALLGGVAFQVHDCFANVRHVSMVADAGTPPRPFGGSRVAKAPSGCDSDTPTMQPCHRLRGDFGNLAATAIGSGTYVYGVYVLKQHRAGDGRTVHDRVASTPDSVEGAVPDPPQVSVTEGALAVAGRVHLVHRGHGGRDPARPLRGDNLIALPPSVAEHHVAHSSHIAGREVHVIREVARA
jgi:hypothetical protein